MNILKNWILASISAACLLLAACEKPSMNYRGGMVKLTPRLKPVFSEVKTVCFGRFLVDVPKNATIAWGHASVNLGIDIYGGDADRVDELKNEFVTDLRHTKAIYHNRVPLLLSEENVQNPSGLIATGYEQFDAINALKIGGFFRWGSDGAVITARPMMAQRDEAIREMKSIARRISFRASTQLPNEAGNCIDSAFLADEGHREGISSVEHIRLGFRLKEFPDTHLSVYIAPSNPHFSEGNSLEFQLKHLEKQLREEDKSHPRLATVYFRRGKRTIGDWMNGWEALSRSPDQPGAHGVHDFVLQIQGVAGDLLRPYADIQMQTGVADNLAGATKPSLTDEEAVAVWDAITSTIRVRPTSTTAHAPTAPRKPLGERVASGRTCPQTGWWQPSEPAAALTLPRQRIKAGAPMPMTIVADKPTPGDKPNGEQPKHEIAAVWQLVAYEE